MEEKIKMIDQYISQLDDAINNNDSVYAEALQTEIIAVYESEIDGIRNGLDNFSGLHFYSETPVDFVGDAGLLRAKLQNYKNNLTSGLYAQFRSTEGAVNVTQHVNQDTNTTVVISLEHTIQNIQELPASVLPDEEKELLSGKLASISAEKDTKKRWEKVSGALKWIAEKGIEVGIAALPYIAKALEATT